MPFLADADLKAAVASLLSKAPADLPSLWDGIITRANADAYGDIKRRLAVRGYTIAQIDAWDDGAEFQHSIGLFWTLSRAAGLHDYNDKFVNRLDRRAELDEVVVLTGAEVVIPGNTTTAETMGTGRIKTQPQDVFAGLMDKTTTPNSLGTDTGNIKW